MKRIAGALAWVLVFAATTTAVAQQRPSPEMMKRVETLVSAFNAPADKYEQFAQENFTQTYLSQQTPAQRRELIDRIQRELGTVDVAQLMREGPTRVTMGVDGSKGKSGRITFEYDPETFKVSSLVLAQAGADPDVPPEAPVNGSMGAAELSAALDAYLGRLTAEGRLSGVLLVARDGKPVFEKAYNLANRSDSIPNSPATRFHIGSINKDFTKIAIAQLAAAGKLTLADTVGKHLPEHANAEARRVTIEQLLKHTGGLAGWFDDEFERASKARFRTNRDVYAYVAPKALLFEPGSQEQYCNSCYVVLGEIIAKLSGMPYERYVERHVFEPAGMRTAGFFQMDEVRPNVATHYTDTGAGLRSIVHQHNAGGNAAGGAWATAADLLALDNAARAGKLLDAKWTAWFFKLDEPASGRVRGRRSSAGGSAGINAAYIGDGTWTVAGLSNFDERFMENVVVAVYRALAG
ncbi:MAG TPA: serine hydrolase domain-containing protein [Thermoanaerobaculia bacterium]|jgi:CubicO group peptidase (beta-lactamase class C family)